MTAADTVRCGIGIRDAMIVALADPAGDATGTLDAGGLPVIPGGADAHCHDAQPSCGGTVCGGTTTPLSFATQMVGQVAGEPLHETVNAYLASADSKKVHGDDAPFTRIANGIPGIEAFLPPMFPDGVTKGRMTVNEFVALTATNPTRMTRSSASQGHDCGLRRRRPLPPGPRADRNHQKNDNLHHNVDVTPYGGHNVTGWPVKTLARGELVWDDGTVLAEAGRGRFCRAGLPGRYETAATGKTARSTEP